MALRDLKEIPVCEDSAIFLFLSLSLPTRFEAEV
jgi:hypothetical protein